MYYDNILICPKCAGTLKRNSSSFICDNRHTFDIAKSGYVNFNQSDNTAGDSKGMVRARKAFLDYGSYKKFAAALANAVGLAKHGIIVDAGCGEGYYSKIIAESLTGCDIYGFDLSKSAVDTASKRVKGTDISALFSVCSIFDLPIKDSSADVVMNLFAPCAAEEFHRILKPNGRLIMGVAGENHLIGLKNALYDNIYLNSPEKLSHIPGFNNISTIKIKYDTVIGGVDNILNLFAMTPYYWKTSQKDADKLKNLKQLETTLDFDIHIFERA